MLRNYHEINTIKLENENNVADWKLFCLSSEHQRENYYREESNNKQWAFVGHNQSTITWFKLFMAWRGKLFSLSPTAATTKVLRLILINWCWRQWKVFSANFWTSQVKIFLLFFSLLFYVSEYFLQSHALNCSHFFGAPLCLWTTFEKFSREISFTFKFILLPKWAEIAPRSI